MSLLLAVSSGAPAEITGVGQIPSAEAFGQPAVALDIAAMGIAGAEVFGTPEITATVDGVGQIPSEEAFGLPTVSIGVPAQEITGVGGIASEEAFGQPMVEAQPVVVFGGGVISWPVPKPQAHDVFGVGGIASEEVFGRPTITPGPRARAMRRREEELLLLAA